MQYFDMGCSSGTSEISIVTVVHWLDYACLSRQCHQNTAPIANTPGTTIRAEFSIHAVAGMPSAMISLSRQICQERIWTPAVKVPSVSNVKTASPVAPAVKTHWTLGNNSKFITTKNASQCSTWVVINRTRAALPTALAQYRPAR